MTFKLSTYLRLNIGTNIHKLSRENNKAPLDLRPKYFYSLIISSTFTTYLYKI